MESTSISEIERAFQMLKRKEYSKYYNLLQHFSRFDSLSLMDKIRVKFLLAKAEHFFGHYPQALEIWLWIIENLNQLKHQKLMKLDVYIGYTQSLWRLGDINKAREIIEQCQQIFQTEFNSADEKLTKEIELRKAQIFHSLTAIHWMNGDINHAIKTCKKSNNYYEKHQDIEELAEGLVDLGMLLAEEGHLTTGLEKLFDAEGILLEIQNNEGLGFCYLNMGWIYSLQGEYDLGLDYLKKALLIGHQIHKNALIASSAKDIANLYRSKGEFLLALNYVRLSVQIFEESKNQLEIVHAKADLIRIYLDQNNLIAALDVLSDLQKIITTNCSKQSQIWYNISKARILLKKKTADDRKTAKQILIILTKDSEILHQQLIMVYLILLELNFIDLIDTNEITLIEETLEILKKISTLANKQHSLLLRLQIEFLIGKLELARGNITQTRQIYIKTQKFAEQYRFIRFAEFISNQHDLLLENQEQWTSSATSCLTKAQQLEFLNLNQHINQIMHGEQLPSIKNEPDLSQLFLITDKHENTLFLQYFLTTWENPHELGEKFLNFINSYKDTQKIEFTQFDRYQFQHYFFIKEEFQAFQIFYLYIGKTFSAKQKMFQVLDMINSVPYISLNLQKAFVAKSMISEREHPEIFRHFANIFTNETN